MADDTRAKILELAVAAIDDGGEAAIRVNKLVAEAGVTPPVLYYHFGSRDGLVIAAQIERYLSQIRIDTSALERDVAGCESREELRVVLRNMWTRLITGRREARRIRANVIGSAFSRPELSDAIAAAQDESITRLVAIVEPCRQRGWFRDDIDLVSFVAWQHSVVFARLLVENGEEQVDLDEWDRLTLESIERGLFGD